MKRAILAAAVAALVLAPSASHSATTWRTVATVTSRGQGFWTTSAAVTTTVPRPYAIRVGFATPTAKRVSFDYSAFCDNRSKSIDGAVRTDGGGEIRWVTVYAGTGGLGDFCDITVYADLADASGLRTVVQYRQR